MILVFILPPFIYVINYNVSTNISQIKNKAASPLFTRTYGFDLKYILPLALNYVVPPFLRFPTMSFVDSSCFLLRASKKDFFVSTRAFATFCCNCMIPL